MHWEGRTRHDALETSPPNRLFCAGLLALVVAGFVTLMGALIGRSSVSGIVVGLVWFIADAIFGNFLLGVSQVASFSGAATSLAANSIGRAAPFGLLVSLLVMVIYIVVPIGVAAYFFREREMAGVG